MQAYVDRLVKGLLSVQSQDDLYLGSQQLLDSIQAVQHIQEYSQLVSHLISHTNSLLRIQGLKLVVKSSPWQEISVGFVMGHFIQDVDPQVRIVALNALETENYHSILELFKDSSQEVQIAAADSFFANTRSLRDDEYILIKMEPLAISQYKQVSLKALEIISKLQLSPKAVNQLLSNDRSKIYSGLMLNLLQSEWFQIRLAVLGCFSSLVQMLLNNYQYEKTKYIVYQIVKILLDAINDEFRQVRISVFQLLADLTPHFVLKKIVDVDSCIFNLREADPDLRQAIYNFLCRVVIQVNASTQKILECLLGLFEKFPEDTHTIYRVAACMGRHNFKHANFILNKLLGVDQRFLLNQQDWNNSQYVAKLIFIVNAMAYDQTVKLPQTVQKHLNYIEDIYQVHFPSRLKPEPNFLFFTEQISFFAQKSGFYIKKHNHIVLSPHSYYITIQKVVKNLINHSLKLQYSFQIDKQLRHFLAFGRLQAHILLLLSFLSDIFTGKTTQDSLIKKQINNIWKSASTLQYTQAISVAFQASQHTTKQDLYDAFFPLLVSLPYQKSAPKLLPQAQILYPQGQISVREYDIISVRGKGPKNLFFIAQYPDSTVQKARAHYFQGYLSSQIRIHRPSTSITIRICFAVLFDQGDILNGSGFAQHTLNLKDYVPVSKYSKITLKP